MASFALRGKAYLFVVDTAAVRRITLKWNAANTDVVGGDVDTIVGPPQHHRNPYRPQCMLSNLMSQDVKANTEKRGDGYQPVKNSPLDKVNSGKGAAAAGIPRSVLVTGSVTKDRP